MARNADTAAAALTDPDIAAASGRKRPGPKPATPRRKRGPNRRGLLRAILSDPRLTKGDKEAIGQAHVDGLSIADLAAFATYEVKIAQRLHELGELDAKALLVAINKAASHVAAAAQLASASNETSGANITVVMQGVGPTSTRSEIADQAQPDPVVGDVIETE